MSVSISSSQGLARRLLLVVLAPVILSTASCDTGEVISNALDATLGTPRIENLEDITLAIGAAAPDSIVFPNVGQGTVTQCTVSPMLPDGLSIETARINGASNNNACRVSGTVENTATAGEVEYTVTMRTTTNSDTATVTLIIAATASATQLFNDAKGVLNTGGQSIITGRDGSSQTVSQ